MYNALTRKNLLLMIRLTKQATGTRPAAFRFPEAAMPGDNYYSNARHREWREKVLRRAGYLCEECKRYGRTGPDGLPVRATTAHHIKHRDEYPELQYVLSNGRALCEKCHNKAHPEKGKKGGPRW